MFETSKDYKIYPIELVRIIKEATNTYTFVFNKPNDLSWGEGAHTHLALDHFNETIGWFEKKDIRHFSIMTLDYENKVGITTRIREGHTPFKTELLKARIGDRYYLFKVGSRLQLRRNNKPVLLISQGVGIASLRPLIKSFIDNPSGIPSIHHINVDSSRDYLFQNEFEAYNKHNFEFTYNYLSSRQNFYNQLGSLFVGSKTASIYLESLIYIIGSDEFILNIREFLKSYGVVDKNFVLDKKQDFYEEHGINWLA